MTNQKLPAQKELWIEDIKTVSRIIWKLADASDDDQWRLADDATIILTLLIEELGDK